MAVRIKFDTSHNPELPTFVLATRSGKKLGKITNISNVHVGDNMNAPMDISFSVHRVLDIDPVNFPDMKNGYLAVSNSSGIYGRIKLNSGDNVFIGVYDEVNHGRNASEIWDDIKNFRKIWIPEWDKWFTLTYSVDESNETVKNVSLVPNSEFELSNVNVHNLEINTESDILREDYTIPTVFYNPDHPEASLLHRILSYTKGFVIKHVDDSLKDIQRTFALDGNNIYDTLQQVGEEIQCLFVYDSGTYADDGSIERAISAYDLRTYCNNCGYRGDYYDHCPKCESTDIIGGYGEDTTIFIDNEALAESINLTTDTDSVKNCFRLLSGDGLMDAAIIATNPNGTQYLWYFTDEMMEDMSPDLKLRLGDYNNDFEFYQNDYTIPMSNANITAYNAVVARYTDKKEDLHPIDDIVGYAELMNAMYDVMDFQIYLESGLLPVISFDTNAQEQADKITPANMPYVAVQNLNARTAATTVNSAVEAAVKILIDQRYTAKIYSSNYESSMYRWTGSFTVTANFDKEDTARTGTMSIYITDTYEIFAKQRIEKAIAGSDKNSYSMAEAFSLDINEFKRRLKMYSRAGLRSFLESCNAAIGVMVELGISNPTSAVLVEGGLNAYYEIYLPYVLKLRAIEDEVATRDEEIAVVQDFYDMLMEQKHIINAKLDINTFLGEKLSIELNSYKMEDDYSNSNYISEGLDNAQLFKRATEFVEIANNEIRKAATEHHSISTTMHNLLTIEEFEPLVDHFAVGNWIRIRIDGKIYRVKLLSYTIDFDNIGSLQVEFSDTIGSGDASLADVFASAQSMAKSYDSVKYQAVSGAAGRATLNTWVQKGLDLTTVRVTNAENQTLQLDQNGMSMSQYDDVTQAYTNFGSRWINTTLAFTKDNWETTETAMGKFEYWDPRTNQYEEGYGVVAKQLIGNLILGNEVGIYNQAGSVTIDENGLTITANGDDGQNMTEFTIQREYTDPSTGQAVTDKQLYIDEDGMLIYKGEVVLESGKTIEEQMEDISTAISEAKTLNVMLSNESQVVPTDKDGNNGVYTDCNTQVFVLYGSADVTSSATITPSPSSGVTGNWNSSTKTYYVTNMTTNSGSVDFTVTFDNLQVTKSMAISKAKAGQSGGQGQPARRYDLIVSHAAISKSTSGTYNPTSLSLTAKYQDGTSSPQNYTGRFKIETTANNTNWTTTYTSSSDQTSYSYNIPANIIAVRCSLYLSGGTTTLLDQQTVPVVFDGASGGDAYTVLLTNESHTFSGDATKALASSTVSKILAYKGSSQIAATIGTISGQPTGMTPTIQNNGTVNAQFTVAVTNQLTTRQGTLTIPITVDGKSFTRNFSWSLSLNGSDGEPTTSYSIESDTVVVKKSYKNALTPSSITFSAFSRSGTTVTRNAYAGRFIIAESLNGSTFTTKYTSSGNESTKTYAISSPDVKIIRCTLYAAGGTTTPLDVQSVAVIADVEGMKIGTRNLIHMSDTLIYKDYGFFGNLLGNGKNLVTNEIKNIVAKYGTYPEETFEKEPEEDEF